MIRDILEDEVDEKYYIKSGVFGQDVSVKNRTLRNGGRASATAKHCWDVIKLDKSLNPKCNQSKASCLTAGGHSGGNHSDMDLYFIQQRPRGENKGGVFTEKSPTLTSCSYEQNNVVVQLNPSKESGGTQPYQGNRIYADYGKRPALMTEIRGGVFRTHYDGRGFRPFARDKFGTLTARAREDGSGQLCASLHGRIRRLTPTECARLQTIPEWYKWACSDSQRYKMLGKYVDKYDKQDKFFLVGYNNASFDNQFLRGFFSQNGDNYFGSWFWSNSIDVMVLASHHLASRRHEMENFKLATVAKFMGINVDDEALHDAFYDIYLTKEVYKMIGV